MSSAPPKPKTFDDLLAERPETSLPSPQEWGETDDSCFTSSRQLNVPEVEEEGPAS